MKVLKRMLKAPVIAAVTLLSACSADIDNYQAASPAFDLFGYFEGDVKAWGMVQDYTEKQTRRFEVDIVGTVEGNELTLVEDFVFDDGELDPNLLVLCLHPQVLLLYLLAQLEVDPLLYLLALRLDDGLLVADGLLL